MQSSQKKEKNNQKQNTFPEPDGNVSNDLSHHQPKYKYFQFTLTEGATPRLVKDPQPGRNLADPFHSSAALNGTEPSQVVLVTPVITCSFMSKQLW